MFFFWEHCAFLFLGVIPEVKVVFICTESSNQMFVRLEI